MKMYIQLCIKTFQFENQWSYYILKDSTKTIKLRTTGGQRKNGRMRASEAGADVWILIRRKLKPTAIWIFGNSEAKGQALYATGFQQEPLHVKRLEP